ncbi:hypothetical protein AWE51_18780 [Aquimarina aggregata]|uniref:Enoyl reductase (ER) domain-containing protein n=1 Tax=Aquimarina aggregata TaxID=1642818 RepID=A0A162WGX3_9FLAO|nr:NAD(P)-dependent alcohol dehydrogenase [Aquimarina aggregata]KZS38092.1 hypothetical protein AWE51_18780 [Aquimarina aggregata]
MKAIVWTKYGSPDLLEYADVPKPVPKNNEILIKIKAATVTAGDCELRRFDIAPWIWLPVRLYMGILKPRICVLGQEFSGEIEYVGKNVTQFNKGDKIFASAGMGMGAYAQYKCLPETNTIGFIPNNMNFEEAATIATGGINGLHFLRKANVEKGHNILINGAGGSIGTYALQIAKSLGAQVTCVDRANKLEMLSTIGADYVIDYKNEDFTKNDKKYDAIIDVVGTSSFKRSLKSLNKNGRYILGNPRFWGMMKGILNNLKSNKKVIFQLANESKKDLAYLTNLIEAGKIKSIIDKRFSLEQVPDAHKYVEAGYKKGNVVISIPQDH